MSVQVALPVQHVLQASAYKAVNARLVPQGLFLVDKLVQHAPWELIKVARNANHVQVPVMHAQVVLCVRAVRQIMA